MKRRDIIIIAALVNAGLLIVLFASAMKSDRSGELTQASSPAAPEVAGAMGQNAQVPTYVLPESQPQAAQSSLLSMKNQEFPQSSLTQPQGATAPVVDATANFADDLKAITFPDPNTNAPVASAQAQPTPASVEERAFIEVKVKKGDVLGKIARNNHVSVAEIMRLNHLSSTNLRIGQVLKVPTQSSSAQANLANGQAQYYIVKSGDNPWAIAVKHHMKVEELLKLNNMDAEQARRLKPGDQLRTR